jgi:hypothetical protein
VTEDGVAGAGSLGQRGEEEQIRRWTEGGKYKRIMAYQSKERENGNGDEAVDKNVERTHESRREMRQQPIQAKAAKQRVDVAGARVLVDGPARSAH